MPPLPRAARRRGGRGVRKKGVRMRQTPLASAKLSTCEKGSIPATLPTRQKVVMRCQRSARPFTDRNQGVFAVHCRHIASGEQTLQ
jgi:hypothetical protein